MNKTTSTLRRIGAAFTGTHNEDELARDLSAFRSPAELSDLAAMLDRYSDDETEAIRNKVDWHVAA